MQIKIRDIQHFLYCPHRWGLMTIDCAWAENYFVTKANLLHERVHDPERGYSARGKRVLTSVSVYCDKPSYEIYGVVDCLEATPSPDGVPVGEKEQLCLLNIVEYKPTLPKGELFRMDDAMQVFAQKVCVDSVFHTDCDCTLYYADAKKRITLPFHEEYEAYYEKLRDILRQMRECWEKSEIPPIAGKQNCSGCSMKDLCMPMKRSPKAIRARIAEVLDE